jgi:solute carrier family 35 protein C2
MENSSHLSYLRDADLPTLSPTESHKPATSASPQFPRPSLTRSRTSSKSPRRSNEDLKAPNAAAALAGLHTPETAPDTDTEMEGEGHRRRRSSLMNSLDTTSKSRPRARTLGSPVKSALGRDSIAEEPKGGDRERLIGDDDRSTGLNDLSEEEGLQDDEETGLTGKDKVRRKQKRRRNTLLHVRVAPEVVITAEEKKEADQYVFKNSLINGLLIALWYIFSLSISIVRSTRIPLFVPLLTSTSV